MFQSARRSLPIATALLLSGAIYACAGTHLEHSDKEHGEKEHGYAKESDEADEESGGEEEDVQVVTLDAAPAAVREAFAKIAAPSTVTKVERQVDEGAVRFEIDFEADGVGQSATLSDGGHVMELERELPVDTLPAAVQAALKHDFPGATVDKAEAVQVSYFEVQVNSGGRKHDVKVYATGDIED